MEQEHPTGGVDPGYDTPGNQYGHRTQRRLYRSRNDRVIAGVGGGLGHYFGIDPVLVRLAFVALAVAGGVGILIYFVSAIILPEATDDEDVAVGESTSMTEGRLIFGGVFIVIGGYLLLREIIPWYSDRIVWGVILVAVGLAVVLRGADR